MCLSCIVAHATIAQTACFVPRYNNKNYRVDEIDWNKKVHDTFDYKGRDITILNYYKEVGVCARLDSLGNVCT